MKISEREHVTKDGVVKSNPTNTLKRQDLLDECRDTHGGDIFIDYWQSAGKAKMSIKEIANYARSLVDVSNNDDKEYYPKLFKAVKENIDDEKVLKIWNKEWSSNAETHGTIFAALYYGKHYRLLDELLMDLNKIGTEFDT